MLLRRCRRRPLQRMVRRQRITWQCAVKDLSLAPAFVALRPAGPSERDAPTRPVAEHDAVETNGEGVRVIERPAMRSRVGARRRATGSNGTRGPAAVRCASRERPPAAATRPTQPQRINVAATRSSAALEVSDALPFPRSALSA